MILIFRIVRGIQLERILNAEASKKKSERLKNVLTQKLFSKYGKGNKVMITALVDQFLIEKGQIGPKILLSWKRR